MVEALRPDIVSLPSNKEEEKLITELDRARANVITQREALTGASARTLVRDEATLSSQENFRRAKDSYISVRDALKQLRSGSAPEKEEEPQNRRAALTVYVEKRNFERRFPEDARRLRTFQTYNSTGAPANFSLATLDYLGTNVNARV